MAGGEWALGSARTRAPLKDCLQLCLGRRAFLGFPLRESVGAAPPPHLPGEAQGAAGRGAEGTSGRGAPPALVARVIVEDPWIICHRRGPRTTSRGIRHGQPPAQPLRPRRGKVVGDASDDTVEWGSLPALQGLHFPCVDRVTLLLGLGVRGQVRAALLVQGQALRGSWGVAPSSRMVVPRPPVYCGQLRKGLFGGILVVPWAWPLARSGGAAGACGRGGHRCGRGSAQEGAVRGRECWSLLRGQPGAPLYL